MKWIIAALALISAQASALTLTTEDYPPFNFSNDGGKTMTGSASDVMHEVLKRTGVKATLSLYPWQRAYQQALDDKDTCVYSTTRTKEREKLFKWVGPVAVDSWVVFAKADSSISVASLDDLKKLKVGAYQGDAKALFLKSKGVSLDEAVNEEQNAKKLDAGRTDVWVTGSVGGPWMAKKVGVKIKPLFTIQEVSMYAACNLAMPDGDVAKMNEAIKAIKSDGSFDKFTKSYQ